MRAPYERLDDVEEVFRRIRGLSPATVLFDVEPLVGVLGSRWWAYWAPTPPYWPRASRAYWSDSGR